MDALGQVVAIEEIRNLHARYWRYVDTKNWPAFGATFAPDARFTEHVTGFSWTGAEEIQAQVAALWDGAVTIHLGHQSEIEVHDADNADAIFVMEDYIVLAPGTIDAVTGAPLSTIHGWGHYVEKLVRIDGRWRLQEVDLYRLRVETAGSAASALPPKLLAQ